MLVQWKRSRQARKSMATMFVALLVMNFFVCLVLPIGHADPPTVDKVANLKVKGKDASVDVTIKVTSHESGIYKVKVKEIENVTVRFDLVNHGNSENRTLAPGESNNFSVHMVTKTASLGQTTAVPFEVYENDVLVTVGTFNVTVEAPKVTPPSNVDCSTCGFFIPLIIVGSVYLVFTGRKPKVE
jgi:hypothetical protein